VELADTKRRNSLLENGKEWLSNWEKNNRVGYLEANVKEVDKCILRNVYI
jgi:hypothetical protein